VMIFDNIVGDQRMGRMDTMFLPTARVGRRVEVDVGLVGFVCLEYKFIEFSLCWFVFVCVRVDGR
jgi:hypothetical protein